MKRARRPKAGAAASATRAKRKVLVIDDSVMLLSFVKEILGEVEL